MDGAAGGALAAPLERRRLGGAPRGGAGGALRLSGAPRRRHLGGLAGAHRPDPGAARPWRVRLLRRRLQDHRRAAPRRDGGGLRAKSPRGAGATVRLGRAPAGLAGRTDRALPRLGSREVRRRSLRAAPGEAGGALQGGEGGAAAAGPAARAHRAPDARLAMPRLPASLRWVGEPFSARGACASARRRAAAGARRRADCSRRRRGRTPPGRWSRGTGRPLPRGPLPRSVRCPRPPRR